MVIAANTMNGPGLTTLPSVASAAGQVLFVVLVVVAAFATSFVLRRLCDVMWKTQKSDLGHSAPQLEDSDIVALSDQLFRQKKLSSLAMVGCALSLALAQMMLCAAIADSMFVALLGQSCGFSPPFNLQCTSSLSMKPFQVLDAEQTPPVSMISAGLLVSSSITISLASVDLDSMLTAQYVLFGCLLVASARFSSTLHAMGVPKLLRNDRKNKPPPLWIGARPFDAVGPVLFNYAFVVTAPPLVCGASNLKKAIHALATACAIMGTLYTIIGFVGAKAATNTPSNLDDNLLSLVLRGPDPEESNAADIFAVVLFGLSQLAAIPVYCELARETLLSHMKMTDKRKAFFLSHVAPWTIVALTYNSALFEAFVEWSSLLLLGFSNFSLPLLLDHKHSQKDAVVHRRRPGTGPDSVVWSFALITASISAVIVQRMTSSIALAEVTFMFTVFLTINYSD